MRYLGSFGQNTVYSSDLLLITHKDLAKSVETRSGTHSRFWATTLAAAFFLLLAGSGSVQAQTATVNWTDVHQVIDGFGASDAFTAIQGGTLSSAQQNFFFGTGSGQLGFLC